MTRHERQVSLASSYYPILIDPTSIPNVPHAQPRDQGQSHVAIPNSNSKPTSPRLRIRYPIPLILLGLAEIIYSTYAYAYTSSTSSDSPSKSLAIARPSIQLMVLAYVRAVVLIGGLGMSKSWRFRGGWVGSLSVVSLGCVVWEACQGQLGSRKTVDGDLEKVDMEFLIMTSVFAITEFLTFMLLLRLSPPPHRQNPFSLRLPNSAVQTPTAFKYSEQPAYLSTPTRRRYQNLSHDYRAGPPPAFGLPVDSSTPYTPRRGNEPDREEYENENEHEDEINEEDFHHDHEPYDGENGHEQLDEMDVDVEVDEFDDSFSSSSISESSIIDLPPPLEPNRLLPPSVSLNSGLNLAALDSSPVIGPLIRRTRSARFTSIRILGRSGSGFGTSGQGRERERELSDGYGTFQQDGGAPIGV